MKNQNLLKLCTDGIIQKIYHEEYRHLPTAEDVPDVLSDTDVDDEDTDSEKE